MLAVGNCCYVAICSAAQGASAPTGGGEGRGHTVAAARLYSLLLFPRKLSTTMLAQFKNLRPVYTRLGDADGSFKSKDEFERRGFTVRRPQHIGRSRSNSRNPYSTQLIVSSECTPTSHPYSRPINHSGISI